MCSVRDDSVVLADDPSAGGLLAGTGGLALWGVGAGLDGNVGWAGCADGALAEQGTLGQGLDLDSGRVAVRLGLLDLPPGGSALQLETAGRTAGGSARTARAALDDHRDSGAGAAPVYLAHLCEMLAWSAGTGLVVCWVLTGFAVATGAVMIRMEDAELENRFGERFAMYRKRVPAVLPRWDG